MDIKRVDRGARRERSALRVACLRFCLFGRRDWDRKGRSFAWVLVRRFPKSGKQPRIDFLHAIMQT